MINHEPYIPTREEYLKLKSFIKNNGKKQAERDSLIFLLTWGRGLRPKEALTLEDWQISETNIHIPARKSKTKKQLNYLIGKKLYQEIKNYIQKNKQTIIQNKGFLFVSKGKKVMTTVVWSDVFRRKYLDKCFNNEIRKRGINGKAYMKYQTYCGRRFFFSDMDETLGDQFSISEKAYLSQHKHINTLHNFYLRKNQRNKGLLMINLLEERNIFKHQYHI